ncbi:MAG: GGDEF domain-containing protein [Hyphomonas sp.]|nr:GGDEF domain-containing protein [Hyphomonas sp.]
MNYLSRVSNPWVYPTVSSVLVVFLVWVSSAPALALDHKLDFEQVVGMLISISLITPIPTFLFLYVIGLRRRRIEIELTGYATTDPLTGALNRRAFQAAVEEEQMRMTRSKSTAAIILFDLDFFKKINDRFGHSKGDEVLENVCRIAHSELRGPFDKIGRWGGEEFSILLHDVNSKQATLVAERIRVRIEEYQFEGSGAQRNTTASFGIAPLTAHCNINSVIDLADMALYDAKTSGRNRVVSCTHGNASELAPQSN